MTLMQWLIIVPFYLILIAFAVYYFYGRMQKRTESQYHIKVKFAHGTKLKLILSETQYASFKEWLNRPDGYYEIQDDKAFVYLDRQYVAAVEMRKQ